MPPASNIQVKDSVVTAIPADYPRAIDLIKRDKLSGLWIRYDFLDKKPKPPPVDLSLLQQVPFLEDFGIAEMAPRRLVHFEAIYELKRLTKLALHAYDELDLRRFPKLETLFLTDGPGVTGLETLSRLAYARITKLRTDDLSFLKGMPLLSKLWLIECAAKRLRGLDAAGGLATLQLSHCSKLEAVEALPKRLAKLTIEKCAHLRDLAFLTKHPTLEFLYVDVMDDVKLVPTLSRLDYLGFANVKDGDLTPLLQSKTLREVAFHPEKRKHYSHSKTQLNALLAARIK